MSASPRPEPVNERRRAIQPVPAELYPAGTWVPPGAALIRRRPYQWPRWFEWLEAGNLTCPAGHHLRNTYEIDQTSSARLRCDHNIGDRIACGLWVWAHRLPGDGHLVIEATLRDVDAIRDCTTASAVVKYLGVFGQLARLG